MKIVFSFFQGEKKQKQKKTIQNFKIKKKCINIYPVAGKFLNIFLYSKFEYDEFILNAR